jgi:hypothetical protein
MSFNYNNFLKSLKVGDTITRVSKVTQALLNLRVTRITPDTIESGTWIFDKKTGGEFDPRIGWEPREGKSGAYIKPPFDIKESFPPPGLRNFRLKGDLYEENELWGEYPW